MQARGFDRTVGLLHSDPGHFRLTVWCASRTSAGGTMSDPLVLLECYAIAAVPAALLLIYAQSRYNRRRERR